MPTNSLPTALNRARAARPSPQMKDERSSNEKSPTLINVHPRPSAVPPFRGLRAFRAFVVNSLVPARKKQWRPWRSWRPSKFSPRKSQNPLHPLGGLPISKALGAHPPHQTLQNKPNPIRASSSPSCFRGEKKSQKPHWRYQKPKAANPANPLIHKRKNAHNSFIFQKSTPNRPSTPPTSYYPTLWYNSPTMSPNQPILTLV